MEDTTVARAYPRAQREDTLQVRVLRAMTMMERVPRELLPRAKVTTTMERVEKELSARAKVTTTMARELIVRAREVIVRAK